MHNDVPPALIFLRCPMELPSVAVHTRVVCPVFVRCLTHMEYLVALSPLPAAPGSSRPCPGVSPQIPSTGPSSIAFAPPGNAVTTGVSRVSFLDNQSYPTFLRMTVTNVWTEPLVPQKNPIQPRFHVFRSMHWDGCENSRYVRTVSKPYFAPNSVPLAASSTRSKAIFAPLVAHEYLP